MKPKREFLDPRKKLVEEVVDWLCGGGSHVSKIRSTPEGACSLAHVAVIVPTAQSARNLRFALAERAARDARGAILPPEITMANALLVLELHVERLRLFLQIFLTMERL